MSHSLQTAIEAMQDVIEGGQPRMTWSEAIKHVAVLLEHVQEPSSASVHLQSAQMALTEQRLSDSVEHLQRVLACLHAQTSAHVMRLSDLLVTFDEVLMVRPFLRLEIAFNKTSGWRVTVHDKSGGIERLVVMVEGLRTDDACLSAAAQLRELVGRHDYV